MDSALQALALRVLDSAPASIEMPAGTGKTHLLAAAVAVCGTLGERSLILTHTNAGVDAIRKRLRGMAVPPSQYRVETLTSWAFTIAGAYPLLAGIRMTEIPDWTQARLYVEGATRVARAAAVRAVHSVSFDVLFVDEYQDCTLQQHEFVLALRHAIPRTVVFGDRLQAIFGFADRLVNWKSDVTTSFPSLEVAPEPHRWRSHNSVLGEWLLSIRPLLRDGHQLDLAATTIPGLSLNFDKSPVGVAAVAHSFGSFDESVVLLDKWPMSVARHASRLGGTYSVMEDISGNFMRDHLGGSSRGPLRPLPLDGDPCLALWLATFAKSCAIGLALLDATVLRRLEQNRSLTGLARGEIQTVCDSLEQLRRAPTRRLLVEVARNIQLAPGVRLYRWEAWTDALLAIRMSEDESEPVLDSLGKVRERLRRQGRRSSSRVASRTLLVKGLEYDHVIIADLQQLRDPRNLYVAMTRARKSITLVTSTATILLENEATQH